MKNSNCSSKHIKTHLKQCKSLHDINLCQIFNGIWKITSIHPSRFSKHLWESLAHIHTAASHSCCIHTCIYTVLIFHSSAYQIFRVLFIIFVFTLVTSLTCGINVAILPPLTSGINRGYSLMELLLTGYFLQSWLWHTGHQHPSITYPPYSEARCELQQGRLGHVWDWLGICIHIKQPITVISKRLSHVKLADVFFHLCS